MSKKSSRRLVSVAKTKEVFMRSRRENGIMRGIAGVFLGCVIVIGFCCKVMAIEQSDILFYAPFDGTTKAQIACGKASVRSIKGEETYEDGRNGQALVCGENFAERCVYKVEDNLNLAEGSVEVWIKAVDWDSLEDADKHHVFFETSTFNDARLLLYKPSSFDKIKFIVWLNGETLYGVSAKATMEKGKWHHVVGTWKEGEVALYIDGELTEKDARPEIVMPQKVGSNFTVGDKAWGKKREGGRKTLLDELTIYNRALSADEIAERFNFNII